MTCLSPLAAYAKSNLLLYSLRFLCLLQIIRTEDEGAESRRCQRRRTGTATPAPCPNSNIRRNPSAQQITAH